VIAHSDAVTRSTPLDVDPVLPDRPEKICEIPLLSMSVVATSASPSRRPPKN